MNVSKENQKRQANFEKYCTKLKIEWSFNEINQSHCWSRIWKNK